MEQTTEPVVEVVAEVVAEAAPEVAPEVAEGLMALSPAQLCTTLQHDIENRPIEQLRDRVEELKNVFYKRIKQQDQAARAEFVANGGDPAEFQPQTTSDEERFKELLALYRQNRNLHTAQSEEQKEANHAQKLAIIEELKALVGSTETIGATFAAFKDLQDRWRAIGPVPIAVNKDLWDTYHHHTENFYNYVQINRELRDMDLKRNYEAKSAICDRAEILANGSVPVLEAFSELQTLHDQYREHGPVSPEHKEALWARFKNASTIINKEHQAHYDKIKEQQLENLAKKTAICERVEALVAADAAYSSLKEWNAAQEQLTTAQAEWKAVGFAPKKDNNAIYERFRGACDKFFAQKREHFAEVRTQQNANLQRKKELCEAAEAFVDSTDFKATADAIMQLQKEWKQTGSVARKDSDALWRRFRGACDKFFDRRGEHLKDTRGKTDEIVTAKRAVMAQLTALRGTTELTFDRLKELMHNYGAAGYLPPKLKAELEVEFKAICDTLFEELRGHQGADRIEKFRQKIAQESTTNNGKSPEREHLTRRLNALQSELKTLENNIGFFGMSKGAEALKADVERKITKAKADITEVKAKLKILSQAQ